MEIPIRESTQIDATTGDSQRYNFVAHAYPHILTTAALALVLWEPLQQFISVNNIE
jgi:hypothetical protein